MKILPFGMRCHVRGGGFPSSILRVKEMSEMTGKSLKKRTTEKIYNNKQTKQNKNKIYKK
jgi:hypothetical protein